MYLRNVTGEPGKGQTQIYNGFQKTIGVVWRGTTAQNVLDAEKEWMKDMEEVIRQEERQRQNESTGVNRARSGPWQGDRHLSVLWEETGECQMGFVN